MIRYVLTVDVASHEIFGQAGEDRLIIIESGHGKILFREQNGHYREDGPHAKEPN